MLEQNASCTMAGNRTSAGRSAESHTGKLQTQGKEKSNVNMRKSHAARKIVTRQMNTRAGMKHQQVISPVKVNVMIIV